MELQIPHEKGKFWGKGQAIVKYRDSLQSPVWNGWTDHDAVWIVGSEWPKESWVRWGQIPHLKWQFWGKGSPTVKYRDFLLWAVQKCWTDRFAIWVVGSAGPKEAQVQSYSPGGANVGNWRHLANTFQLVLPSVHPSPQPKRQIDMFNRFCKAYCSVICYTGAT